jgi:hypothetical protein
MVVIINLMGMDCDLGEDLSGSVSCPVAVFINLMGTDLNWGRGLSWVRFMSSSGVCLLQI